MERVSTWAAARFQLKPCCSLVNSKFSTAYLRIKGKGKEATTLTIIVVKGDYKVTCGGTRLVFSTVVLQDLRTILYPPKGISCIKHVKHQCVCVGGEREEEICV